MLEVNRDIPSVLLVFGLSFLLTFLLVPITIRAVGSLNYLDKPLRPVNSESKPTLGGIAIFIGFVFGLILGFKDLGYSLILNLILAVFIMLVIGMREDIHQLKSYQKLLGQIAAAMIIVGVCDIRLNSLYGIFGVEEMHVILSYVISTFTIIVITNAYNLIDGIDGLAGSVGLIASLFFGIWFYLNGELGLASISLALAGALMAFINFNWAPSKIFMGDTGSLFIGFFLSIASIAFIDLNSNLKGSEYAFGASIGTAIAVLIIPLADTLRVFIKRIARGESPMHPDRTHTHHILLRLGCNHAQATGILVTVNIIFVLLALVLRNLSDTIVISVILLTALALSTILDFIFRSAIDKRREELREEIKRNKKKQARVVPFDKSAG